MKTLLGWMMTGGLLLGYASTSEAQITIQPGRNGSPSVTFGQPTYGPQYAPQYAQPNYAQPNYVQPGFAPTFRPNYVQPPYQQPYQGNYSSGYSQYSPGMSNYPYNTYPNSGYPGPYRQPGYSNNGYYPNTQPYRTQSPSVIINGQGLSLPR